MVISKSTALMCLAAIVPSTHGFSFVPQSSSRSYLSFKAPSPVSVSSTPSRTTSSSLSMVDNNVVMGAGIAIAGLVSGIGLVAFAENMGERGRARGGGLSSDMATKLSGALLEDVEVDSVSDLSSLTEKLEAALKETGGAKEEELQMTEEEKKRIAQEADDGW
ncbi:hypothetical protein HJC23_009876 [Cyclotella cryptica]|uniref:Uncharacterized protein n=1 Tax=Cyclotella cryptica TaxID=29204 RepID=A0ABD3QBQ5_9STRA|eukprot:CCRYP_006994-RA/>CCRYP_006994-RA protein AED:0.47 eAED:0.47 QI:0/-1/0/1/-1/1/1/0/162